MAGPWSIHIRNAAPESSRGPRIPARIPVFPPANVLAA
jgi:hypothetical protein